MKKRQKILIESIERHYVHINRLKKELTLYEAFFTFKKKEKLTKIRRYYKQITQSNDDR